MPKVERRDLINYAFVSQGIFGANDLLAAILPLIQPIVSELEGQLFNPKELADKIAARFPWNISPDAIELLPPRMEKLGWVERILNNSGAVAYVFKSIPDVPYDETQARQLEEKLSNIGLLFHEFINEISPLEGIAYTASELEELLLQWLVDSGGFDKSSIISAANFVKSAVGEIDEEFVLTTPSMKDVKKFKTQENYLCGRFIQHISNRDREVFDDIVSLSSLALIAEVILTYQSPNIDDVKPNVVFYYDGPFIMDLLGLTGGDRKENANYINDALIKLQIMPRALSHSCDEIRDNLNAMHAMPRPRRHGPTWAAICRADIQESFADDVRQNVEV